MRPRLVPAVIAVIGLGLAAAACGSDDTEPAAPSSDSTLPPVGSDDGFEHPTGADDVVVSYAELGGFTTREFAFQQTPRVLVSGDGRVFSPGAQIAIYPGPLLPAVQVQPITDDGIQDVLAAAEEAGLFAEIDYTIDSNIADATTATVTISANGETWVHEAYALDVAGNGVAETPERQALLDFVMQLADLQQLVGEEALGETELFEPTEYAIEALVVDDLSAFGTDGIDPTVVDWPAEVPVRLADAQECTVVAASEVGELLAAANQLTFFDESGVTYQVLARPVLPGQAC
jgi:hypothetical protein